MVILLCLTIAPTALSNEDNFTLISEYDYLAVQQQADNDIQHLIDFLKPHQNTTNYLHTVVITAMNYFQGRPYLRIGAQGEGDWCEGAMTHRCCLHIQQDPIYRTDSFVCNTLVQTILALINANNIEEYRKNILSINYGSANEPPSHIHLYNRNHFTSIDFNPINQKNGLLKDVTDQGVFKKLFRLNKTLIDKQSWFDNKMQAPMLKKTVRLLLTKNSDVILKRTHQYPAPFHKFYPKLVTLKYIPKSSLFNKIRKGNEIIYEPKEAIINQLPTPSVVEIVRDSRQWRVNNQLVEKLQGSANDVSHVGFIHREYFKYHQMIYYQFNFERNGGQNIITKIPIFCEKKEGCTRIMFDHATDIFPNHVLSIPLQDYLTSYRYGHYVYMDDPSLLGIHVEKIMNTTLHTHFK